MNVRVCSSPCQAITVSAYIAQSTVPHGISPRKHGNGILNKTESRKTPPSLRPTVSSATFLTTSDSKLSDVVTKFINGHSLRISHSMKEQLLEVGVVARSVIPVFGCRDSLGVHRHKTLSQPELFAKLS